MSHVLATMGFHKSGKPRGWLRRVLFESGATPRSIFRAVVFKKNGNVRPRFSAWIQSRARGVASADSASDMAAPAVEPSVASIPERTPEDIAVSSVLYGPSTLEETVGYWRHHRTPELTLDADEVESAIASARLGARRFVICLSHDNYESNSGGIQNCIRRERKHLNDLGADYLNMHPFQPLPRLAHLDEDPDPFVNLVLNGAPLGCCRMSSVVCAVRRMAKTAISFEIVVHHLLGFQPEQVRELVEASLAPKLLFWLHDFFSECPGYTLQRNNKVFCNAPPPDSNACRLCIYGKERPAHLARLKRLFETTDVHVVSPSEVTLSFWKARTKFRVGSTHVAPHVILDWTARATPCGEDAPAAVTIGYLGYHMAHKGWPVFERIAKALEGETSLRFVSLGADAPADSAIAWNRVVTSRDNEIAMTEAVARESVDIVLHWPTWPETFSFTTYEALAGGAFVVTNPTSGNIAATVEATGCGVVLNDESSLLDFFSKGDAKRLAEEARGRRRETCVTSKCSGMSMPLLFGGRLIDGRARVH